MYLGLMFSTDISCHKTGRPASLVPRVWLFLPSWPVGGGFISCVSLDFMYPYTVIGFRVLCRSSLQNSEKSKLLVALTSERTEPGFKCKLNFTRSNRRSYLRVYPHVTRGGQILSQAIDVFCSVGNTLFFNTSLKSTWLICLLCSAVSFVYCAALCHLFIVQRCVICSGVRKGLIVVGEHCEGHCVRRP